MGEWNRRRRTQQIGFFIGPLLFAVMVLWPLPEGTFTKTIHDMGVTDPASVEKLSQGLQTVIGLTVLMVSWWITEAVPIPVTALLPGVLLPLLNVHGLSGGTVRAFTSTSAFHSYAHPVVYLFLAGFLLAAALTKHRLDRRLTLRLLTLGRIAERPPLVLAAMMTGTALISMWVSNTASAAIMLPLALGVGDRLVAAGSRAHVRVALLLGIAWSASIGGVTTLVGSPPNGIAVSILDQQGIAHIGFLDWLLIGLPVAVLLLPMAWLVLLWQFPLRTSEGHSDVAALFAEERARLGEWSPAERRTLGVFITAVILWGSRPFWERIAPEGIASRLAGWDVYEIGLLCAALLFFIPAGKPSGERLLDWSDAQRIDWGTLILFGGGLALSAAMFQTGMAQWLTQTIVAFMGTPPMWVLIAVAALFLNFLTEITSNTAVTSMMVPILVALGIELGANPLPLVLAATLNASMAFMLPVATPPNALVYGTGHISIGQMVRAGFRMNLLGWAAIMFVILVVR